MEKEGTQTTGRTILEGKKDQGGDFSIVQTEGVGNSETVQNKPVSIAGISALGGIVRIQKVELYKKYTEIEMS
jgi:hypothetical protein